MSSVQVDTIASSWQRLFATNSTASSFASRAETLTRPVHSSTQGIIEMSPGGGAGPNGLMLLFFGTDANNENFNARILGWDYSLLAGVEVWNFVVLCQFAVTLGNIAGVAGGEVSATGFVADTIALTYGNDDVSVDITSPANDVRAHAILDTKGCRIVEVQFDMNSSAASANCLYRKM